MHCIHRLGKCQVLNDEDMERTLEAGTMKLRFLRWLAGFFHPLLLSFIYWYYIVERKYDSKRSTSMSSTRAFGREGISKEKVGRRKVLDLVDHVYRTKCFVLSGPVIGPHYSPWASFCDCVICLYPLHYLVCVIYCPLFTNVIVSLCTPLCRSYYLHLGKHHTYLSFVILKHYMVLLRPWLTWVHPGYIISGFDRTGITAHAKCT
jgi:hypothetical protein